ncbi:TPA: hypothetical protein IAA87_05720 [Candidatus Avigastranaerophilus faecigallinarum]|nr:hypothetical protein [Candidatus Avigastranaerophilus faecigallinarum]
MQTQKNQELSEIQRQVSIGLPLSIIFEIDKKRGPIARSEYLRKFIISNFTKLKEA